MILQFQQGMLLLQLLEDHNSRMGIKKARANLGDHCKQLAHTKDSCQKIHGEILARKSIETQNSSKMKEAVSKYHKINKQSIH